MKKVIQNLNMHTILIKRLLSIVAFIVLLVAIYAVLHNGNQTPSNSTAASTSTTSSTGSTTTPANAYAILAPATVTPKLAECNTPITYSSNGNSGPIQCPNGDLNVVEWNALSALEPEVMSLGYTPSFSAVQSALCTDASDSNSDATTKDSNVIETTTYQIAALYYGWNFSTNPTSILANKSC